MKRFVIFFLSVVAVALLIQCKKDNGSIIISGILQRDDQGNVKSDPDNDLSDWQWNQSVPTQIENKLRTLITQFAPNYSGSFDPLNPPGSVTTQAFPNPCTTTFVFKESVVDTTYACSFALVDKDLNFYKSGSITGGAIESVDVSSLPAGLYRLYYIYFDSQMHIIYKGYGDISKQ